MLRPRVIPCLLLLNDSLVKTVRFGKYSYIGDPANTCRIFNELEVDELSFLDIGASKQGRKPNGKVLSEIASECFMPVSYGGGIASLQDAEQVLKLGFEKVILNTEALKKPSLINEIAKSFGSQSVVVAIDVKTSFWGKQRCLGCSGSFDGRRNPVEWAKEIQQRGAGEVLLTSIDKEGTWAGFDLKLIQQVSEAVSIPVIASGGAGSTEDIGKAVKIAGASAVALGSMVVFQKKGMGVLVNYPEQSELERVLN